VPSAEDLGSHTAAAIRKGAVWASSALTSFVTSCREWGRQARDGFRDLIDLQSVTREDTDPRRSTRTVVAPSKPVNPDSATRPAPGRVALVQQGRHRSDVLEVSMLESLGFYDPATEIVVTVAPQAPPMPPGIAPSPIEPVQRSGDSARQLIPDVDLGNWKPHVIARSKLGRQRMSAATIVILSLVLLAMTALVLNLLRAPADQEVRDEGAVIRAANGLATSLTRLDPILADATTDVAEATSLLISVDTAARDLFDATASLTDGTEQQVLRQSAGSLAQRALQLESLVGEALSYRLVLNPLWRSPDLAGVTDPTQAAVAISAWEAQLADMSAILPDAAELSSHVQQVAEFVGGIEAWRIRYIDALAVDDVAGAEAAVADLEGQLALLAQSGEESLTAVFADAGAERGRILADLAVLTG
jgi:hypothetical protein